MVSEIRVGEFDPEHVHVPGGSEWLWEGGRDRVYAAIHPQEDESVSGERDVQVDDGPDGKPSGGRVPGDELDLPDPAGVGGLYWLWSIGQLDDQGYDQLVHALLDVVSGIYEGAWGEEFWSAVSELAGWDYS